MEELNPVSKVLKFIAKTLNEKGISWILAGSTASYLNGLDVKPKDLDILTDEENAYKIDEIFAEGFEVLRKMSYGETEIYASHFGRYKVQNVFVEVIGDLKIKYGKWEFFVPLDILLKYSKVIKLNDTLIRVIPLEAQLIYNLMIPDKKQRVKKIISYFKTSKQINYEVLNLFLGFAPKEIRTKVFEISKNL